MLLAFVLGSLTDRRNHQSCRSLSHPHIYLRSRRKSLGSVTPLLLVLLTCDSGDRKELWPSSSFLFEPFIPSLGRNLHEIVKVLDIVFQDRPASIEFRMKARSCQHPNLESRKPCSARIKRMKECCVCLPGKDGTRPGAP